MADAANQPLWECIWEISMFPGRSNRYVIGSLCSILLCVPSQARFLQTDPIGTKDDLNLYAYAGLDPANGIDPDGLRDIFIGGGGDMMLTGIVRDFANSFRDNNPSRDVVYLGWIRVNRIVDAINSTPRGEPVNLIGHSYGAHSAALAAGRSDRHVNLLITIDPVGRSHAVNPMQNVSTWINVTATPSKRNRDDTIAAIGGKPPDLDTSNATENYSIDTNHGDFAGMMNVLTSTGDSVKQRLRNSQSKPKSSGAASHGKACDNGVGAGVGSVSCGSDFVVVE